MEQDRIGSAVGALHKRTGVVGDEAASVERQRRGLLLILAVRGDCLGADTVSRDHRNEIRRRVTLHAALQWGMLSHSSTGSEPIAVG